MRYERHLWSTVTPWSQILGADGLPWTVTPHWPPPQKRITRQGGPVLMFTPRPADVATVLVPDDDDAFAAIAATFGVPEVLAWQNPPDQRWYVPAAMLDTVNAHLRDWHGTMDLGTTHHRTGSPTEALHYHWQCHQQQLVLPLPRGHHVHVA